jgi:tRNA pseudouridine55 synthase
MDRMFLVDKPEGLTSSRVVERIKRKFNVKAGHTGTLDPLATGLLVVLTGKFTKNASSFLTPRYSAKKIAGRKAYQLARKGISVDMPPSRVSIHSLELREFQFPYFTIACEVSSGFYVRSLAHDIGEKLGVGATVTHVRRTRVGPYRVEQAKRLEEILDGQ